MVDLRWNQNSGDRPQYKTPKPYDYAQAVIDTAPKHPGNVAGDPPQFVKSSKITATRGEGTQGNLTRGQGTQRNRIRGKGTRENMTRGKDIRKKGAGERDATKKNATETSRSGRENTGAPGLKDLDPNLGHNLDPNLDPNLGPNTGPNLDPDVDPHLDPDLCPDAGPHLDYNLDLILQYNRATTGNLHHRAAPITKDGPRFPQGTGWKDPEDIGDRNRPLNNLNDDNDEIGQGPHVSEKENEQGEEQPFGRPMMSRKVIASQSRGKTRGYDQTLQYENENSDGAWVPAIYHESIRLDLIHKANLKGEYEHERGSSFTPGDITSYLESQRTWGTDRGGKYDSPGYIKGNWPPILYQLRKPGNFSKSNYPEAEIWKYGGRVVLSVQDSRPLRKYENLPDTISSKISGAELEAMLRLDPRVEARDIRGRMPMYYISETGKRVQSFTVATFSMRTHRFRAKEALLCWRERAGSSTTNELILNWLKEHEPRAFQVGDVEGIGPIPKELEEAILGSNKSNPAVINRAGKNYALDKPDQPRPKVAPGPTKRLRDNRSRSPHATRRTIRDREKPPGQLPAASGPPRGRPRIKDLPPTAALQSSEQQQQQRSPASGPARQGVRIKKIQGQAPPQLHEQEPPPGGARMKKIRGQAPPQHREQQSPMEGPNKRGNSHGRAPSQSPERQPPQKRARMETTQQRRAPPRYPGKSLEPRRRPLTRGHEDV